MYPVSWSDGSAGFSDEFPQPAPWSGCDGGTRRGEERTGSHLDGGDRRGSRPSRAFFQEQERSK
jgi:hypothetical protein